MPNNTQNCKNCGHIIQLKYCENCGQAKDIKPFNLKFVFTEILNVVRVNKEFYNTLFGLIKNPNLVFENYINGKQKDINNPVKFFITVFLFFYIIALILPKNEFGFLGNSYYLLLIPVLTFSLKMLFFKKLSWNNAMAYSFYISGILLSPLMLTSYLFELSKLIHQDKSYFLLIIMFIVFLLQIFYMYRLIRLSFEKSKISAALLSFVFNIIFYTIITLIAYFFEEG